jgi:hypothetical protein
MNYTPIEQVNQPLIRFRKYIVSKTLLIKLNGTVFMCHDFFHVGWVGICFVCFFDWSLWLREIIETASEGESFIARSDPLVLVTEIKYVRHCELVPHTYPAAGLYSCMP